MFLINYPKTVGQLKQEKTMVFPTAGMLKKMREEKRQSPPTKQYPGTKNSGTFLIYPLPYEIC